jgi:hypothetical protein
MSRQVFAIGGPYPAWNRLPPGWSDCAWWLARRCRALLPDVHIDVTLLDFDIVVIYHDFDIEVGG